MKLWGKTQMQLDAERNEMIARREHIARRDQEAKTPAALGQRYGQALQPVRRQYYYGSDVDEPIWFDSPGAVHFGTDIPAPTMEDAEMARAVDHGSDDAGHTDKWIAALAFLLPIALVLALVYLIRQ